MVRLTLQKHARTIALVLVTAVFSSLLSATATAQYYQENMVNARNSLQNAINWLYKANADKGGHRQNAINLARQAIYEVNAGIHYANGGYR
jgi:hypothetical protein